MWREYIPLGAIPLLMGTASVLGMLVISGCNDPNRYNNSHQESGARVNETFITKIHGCTISKVDVEHLSYNIYMAQCDAASAVSTLLPQKHPQYAIEVDTQPKTDEQPVKQLEAVAKPAIEFSTAEKKVLEQADKIRHKYEILDKLSTEDKATLGFTVEHE